MVFKGGKINRPWEMAGVCLACFLLFTLFLPRAGTCQTVARPRQPATWTWQARQAMADVARMVSPFLGGPVPRTVSDKILQIVSRAPSTTLNLQGQHLLMKKVMASLFPRLCENTSFDGEGAFTLTLKREKTGTSRIVLTLNLTNPVIKGPYLVTASRMTITIRLTVDTRTREMVGTFTAHLATPLLTLRAPIAARISADQIDIQGSLAKGRYAIKVAGKRLLSPKISWEKHLVQGLQIQVLSLTPEKVAVRSLSARYHSQRLSLESLSLSLPTLKARIKGVVDLNLSPDLLPSESPIESLDGRIQFALSGEFKTPTPALSGTLQSEDLRVKPYYAPVMATRFRTKFRYRQGRLTLPTLDVVVKNAMRIKATATIPHPAHLLSGTRAEISLHISSLKALQPLIQSLFPDFLPNIEADGDLSLKATCLTRANTLSTAGSLALNGSLKNILAPIVLRNVSLNVPFNLQIPLVGHPAPLNSGHLTTPAAAGGLKISSVEFGFLKIHHVSGKITARGHALRLVSLAGELLLGTATGNGQIDLFVPYHWKTALRFKRVSLHNLCDRIAGMKDALSGRVNASLTLAGDGGKVETMRGAFEANVVKTSEEPRRISQAFIRKMTGKKGRFLFYGKYRPFNKGVIRAEIERGIIVFKTLEISHSFLGFKDLSMSVSRFANRISLKDLIWEILQVPSGQSMSNPVIKTK